MIAAHTHPMPMRPPRRVVAVAMLLLAAVALGAPALRRLHTPVMITIPVGRLPDALATDAGAARAFVADDARATVSVLDLAAARVLHTIAVGPPAVLAPLALAVDARTHHLFVANRGDNGALSVVRLLDSRSGAPLATVRVGPEADALAVDERGHVVVATEGDSRVSLLDARTGRLLHTIHVGLAPAALAVDSSTARAFVVGAALLPTGEVVGGQVGLVGVLDTRTAALVRTVVVGYAAGALAVDARSARVFVANSGDDTVSVLDARTGVVLRTVTVGRDPAALAVDARAGRVFVVDEGDGTLSVLDARTGRLLRRRAVLGGDTARALTRPYAIAVDEARARVYVTAWGQLDRGGLPTGSGLLAVLDARDGALLRTLAVGVAPRSVAVEEGSGRIVVANGGVVIRAPAGWGEPWVGQLRAWLPWLGRLGTPAPSLIRVPGGVSVIEPAAR